MSKRGNMKRRGVVVITTALFFSKQSEVRFWFKSCSKVCDGENLLQWSWLDIRLNTLLSVKFSLLPFHQTIRHFITIGITISMRENYFMKIAFLLLDGNTNLNTNQFSLLQVLYFWGHFIQISNLKGKYFLLHSIQTALI